LQGKPLARPGMLRINWQQRMNFDGQTALFEEAVTAHGLTQRLETETLEARFSQPIKFRDGENQPRPDLDGITCRGGVFLEGRTYAGPVQESWEQFEVEQLMISRATGQIFAQGPGHVRTIRPQSSTLLSTPGMAAARSPSADPKQLAYLHVQFEHSLAGNLDARTITFYDRVRSVYGKVPNWRTRLDINDPDALGDEGVSLSSEQLTVAQAVTPLHGERSMELQAQGNVLAENRSYTARADRVTYDEAKDMLVLEGNGHAEAQLSRQEFIGGAFDDFAARKILFWPTSKRVEAVDLRSGNMSGMLWQ